MWIAEFKVWHAGSTVLEASRGLDAACASVYLNLVHHKGRDFVEKVMVISGRDEKKLVAAVLADKRLRINHVEGNQVFYENTSAGLFHSHIFNSKVFFVKPFVIKGGFEYWTVASWDKRELLDLKRRIARLKGKATIQLLSVKKAPVNIFLPALFTQLTAKQLGAFVKAVDHGYYTIPRKVSLEQLSQKLGVARTTLRERLRKAESKLLPQLAKNILAEPALRTLK